MIKIELIIVNTIFLKFLKIISSLNRVLNLNFINNLIQKFMELTYTKYLKIEELLSLQERKSNPEEHDEMLFIVIHQTYELWFKQILFELDLLKVNLKHNKLEQSQKTLKRVNTILKVLVHQIDILETMDPLEFLSFRNYLESASGFQSFQFRELEFLLGQKRKNILDSFKNNQFAYEKLTKRFDESSLWDDFLTFLSKNNYQIPEILLKRDFSQMYEPNDEIQMILVDIYHNKKAIAGFCELLVDLDEGLQEWRYRHVKMVERTIGSKTGSGGSTGADYLKSTLFKPVFPDLWITRSRFENVSY
jgi:tryptophan 2,3-dioxygenase